MDKLISSVFLKFRVEKPAVSNHDLSDSVLFKQERIAFLILLSVFISQVLKQDGLLLSDSGRVQMSQRLVIGASELGERTPLVRGILTDKDLAAVGLASEVDLLGVNLVRDVDKEHVEVVVAHMVRLEYYLHFVGLIGRNGSLLRDEDERHLLPIVLDTAHLALQVEINWEARDILDRECLLGSLTHDHITEWQDSILRCDFDFRTDTCTLEQNRDHRVIREHHDSLFLDLLEQWLELHNDGLSLTWLNRAHCIQDREATVWSQCLQPECLLHSAHVLNKDLHDLLVSHGDLSELKHISVRNKSLRNSRSPDFKEQSLHSVALLGIHPTEIDRQEPVVVLGTSTLLLHVEVGDSATHRLENSRAVEGVLECLKPGLLSLFCLLAETLLLGLLFFDLLLCLLNSFASGSFRIFLLGILRWSSLALGLGVGSSRSSFTLLFLPADALLKALVPTKSRQASALRLLFDLGPSSHLFMGLVSQITEQRVEFD